MSGSVRSSATITCGLCEASIQCAWGPPVTDLDDVQRVMTIHVRYGCRATH